MFQLDDFPITRHVVFLTFRDNDISTLRFFDLSTFIFVDLSITRKIGTSSTGPPWFTCEAMGGALT